MKLCYDNKKEVFYCISSYDERDIPKSNGFWWDPSLKRWYTPDPSKAKLLVEFADKETKKLLADVANPLEASRATDSEEDFPSPAGLSYMPFQKAAISFAKDKKGVLVADEMGLGKTITSVGVINSNPWVKKVLVICPASLKINWNNEIEKWIINNDLSIGISEGSYFPDTDIVIINYDIVGKHREKISAVEWDVLICDEAHYLKNPKAARTKYVVGEVLFSKNLYPEDLEDGWEDLGNGWYKLVKIPPIKAKKKLFLTGTPIVNKPQELWPLVHYLDPDTWKSKSFYTNRYCGGYGGNHKTAINLDELQFKLRTSVMIRRLKKDVLKELPSKTRQIIEIPPVGNLKKAIKAEREALKDIEKYLSDLKRRVEILKASENKEDYVTAVAELREGARYSFTELAKIRKDTALVKVPYIISYVKDTLLDNDDHKVVVFVYHTEVVDLLMEGFNKLGLNPVKLDGRMSNKKERQESVNRFQEDPNTRVFVGTIKAAGVGITLTASSHVIFGELDWVPGNISQAEDRCHRIGQEDNVLVQHLVIEGSIDSTMAKTLLEKQRVIDKALDFGVESKGGFELLPISEPATSILNREDVEKEAEKLSDKDLSIIRKSLKEVLSDREAARSIQEIDLSILKNIVEHDFTAKKAVLVKTILLRYRDNLDLDSDFAERFC